MFALSLLASVGRWNRASGQPDNTLVINHSCRWQRTGYSLTSLCLFLLVQKLILLSYAHFFPVCYIILWPLDGIRYFKYDCEGCSRDLKCFPASWFVELCNIVAIAFNKKFNMLQITGDIMFQISPWLPSAHSSNIAAIIVPSPHIFLLGSQSSFIVSFWGRLLLS